MGWPGPRRSPVPLRLSGGHQAPRQGRPAATAARGAESPVGASGATPGRPVRASSIRAAGGESERGELAEDAAAIQTTLD
jgi:hypothetical protein